MWVVTINCKFSLPHLIDCIFGISDHQPVRWFWGWGGHEPSSYTYVKAHFVFSPILHVSTVALTYFIFF